MRGMRRGYGRRRPTFKRRMVRRKVAKRRFTRFANRVLRTAHEKKYVESFSMANTPSTTANDAPFVLPITAIAQGDSENTRDGDQVYLRSIEVHIRAKYNYGYQPTQAGTPPDNPWSSAASDPNTMFNDKVRLLIWQWLPTSDSASGAGGALPGSVLQRDTTMSPYNHDQRRNFRILYDKSIRLHNPQFQLGAEPVTTTVVDTTHGLADFKVRIRKFGRREITWQGSTTSANCHCYAAVLTDWSTSGSGAGSKPVLVVYDVKTNFSDK